MADLCGHQGFAGPSACIKPRGHCGAHSYGDFHAAVFSEQRKDAERYRWLRLHYDTIDACDLEGGFSVRLPAAVDPGNEEWARELDEAIDKSMAREGNTGEAAPSEEQPDDYEEQMAERASIAAAGVSQ